MKKNSIIILALFILYVAMSLAFFYKNPLEHYYANELSEDLAYDNIAKNRGYDFTDRLNSDLFDTLFVRIDLSQQDLDDYNRYFSFNQSFSEWHRGNYEYAVTNQTDLKTFMENNKITNPRNIKFDVKNEVPLSDPKYKKIFKGLMPDKKIIPNVISKDKDGYSKFDLSVDAIVLLIRKGEIVAYANLDNRYFDTRAIMNKFVTEKIIDEKKEGETFTSTIQNTLKIVPNKDKSYNKYKIEYITETTNYGDDGTMID